MTAQIASPRGSVFHHAVIASAARWRRPTLLAHGQDVARLAIERDGARPVHGLEVLLDNELGGALFLDDLYLVLRRP